MGSILERNRYGIIVGFLAGDEWDERPAALPDEEPMGRVIETKRIDSVLVARAAQYWMLLNRQHVDFLDGDWCPGDEPHYAESRECLRKILDHAIDKVNAAVGDWSKVPPLIEDGEPGPNDPCLLPSNLGMGAFTALREARKRWGDEGFVRWRRAEVEEILGREAHSTRLFQVGRFVLSESGEHFCRYGEGPTWEDAFAKADQAARED